MLVRTHASHRDIAFLAVRIIGMFGAVSRRRRELFILRARNANAEDHTRILAQALLLLPAMKAPFHYLIIASMLAFLPTPTEAAPYAIAAEKINLRGHHLLCDSFDSADPGKSTDGRYDPAKAGDSATVGLIQGIFNSSSVGNAEIWGYLETRVPFSLDIGPEGSVGSTAWHLAGMTGIEPGHQSTNFNVPFPDPVAPFPGLLPVGGTVDGVTYTYILSTGNYDLDVLTLAGNDRVLVIGDATLHVRGNVKLSGNALIQIEPSASLRLFVGGESASFGGGGISNLSGPAAFLYVGLAANTSVTFKANSLRGSIYAPRTDCTLGASGNGGLELEGSMVVKSLSLDSDVGVHFDEALGR